MWMFINKYKWEIREEITLDYNRKNTFVALVSISMLIMIAIKTN